MVKGMIKEIARAIYRFGYRIKYEYTFHNMKVRSKYKKEWQLLKDCHKGERCFIIGNGPSLTAEDLTALKNEYTFAANRIFYMFDKTEWRPTYYCAQDWIVVKDIADKFHEIIPNCKKAFIGAFCDNYLFRESLNDKNVLLYVDIFPQSRKSICFSENVERHVFDGGTVTYAAIQIAVYLGFSEIYLLGVDHNYSSNSFSKNSVDKSEVKTNYFEGMPSDIKVSKPNTDGSTLSFLKANEYAQEHGIRIFNATRGGKLEVFPRVQLESVLR